MILLTPSCDIPTIWQPHVTVSWP